MCRYVRAGIDPHPSLRPTEVVRSSEPGGNRKKQEDSACALNCEVEYDECDRE